MEKNMKTEEYKQFSQEFEDKQELQRCLKLAQLEKEEEILPLKRELLAHIDAITMWLDLCNEWFLESRDLNKNEEKHKLNLVIYQFYKTRSDFILEEIADLLPKEFQNG